MGAQYRLWSFVRNGFVIRAQRQSAFVCMGMCSEGGGGDGLHCILLTTRFDQHNAY